MFKVGDKIVYPMHGAGTIESIEEREILGEKQKYYVMKMPVGDIQVMVPTKNAELIGVRDVVGNDVAQNVFEVLSAQPTDMSTNWNKRYRDNQEKMKSGDICELADVVRNLAFRQKSKGLATGEKKMLSNAKQILISELVLAESMTKEQVELMINDKIDAAYTHYVEPRID
ncbi:MAG: CarD family transcriptional regulator [Clostridia bacterium]|nr:CarD family transcriptional regulator [Clostridia bacterium]